VSRIGSLDIEPSVVSTDSGSNSKRRWRGCWERAKRSPFIAWCLNPRNLTLLKDFTVQFKALLSGVTIILLLQHSDNYVHCAERTSYYAADAQYCRAQGLPEVNQTFPSCGHPIASCSSKVTVTSVETTHVCKPSLHLGTRLHAFTGMLALNQVVFVVAATLRYRTWLHGWGQHISLCGTAVACVASFGKVVVVFSILFSKLSFVCDIPDLHYLCSEKSNNVVELPGCLRCASSACPLTYDCSDTCSLDVPAEIYLLVFSFLVSFVYLWTIFHEYRLDCAMVGEAREFVRVKLRTVPLLLGDFSAFIKLVISLASILLIVWNGSSRCFEFTVHPFVATRNALETVCMPTTSEKLNLYLQIVASVAMCGLFVTAILVVRLSLLKSAVRAFALLVTVCNITLLVFVIVAIVTIAHQPTTFPCEFWSGSHVPKLLPVTGAPTDTVFSGQCMEAEFQLGSLFPVPLPPGQENITLPCKEHCYGHVPTGITPLVAILVLSLLCASPPRHCTHTQTHANSQTHKQHTHDTHKHTRHTRSRSAPLHWRFVSD